MVKPAPFRQAILVAAMVLGTCIPAWPGAADPQVDPFGNCCVSRVSMRGYDAWTVTCGPCSTNPGQYALTQPDPAKLVFVGPGGVTAASPYDAAQAICNCPSQDSRRAREQRMRTFDGQ